MELPPTGHDPVLLAEVIQTLRPDSGQTFIDCTLGRGGHALAVARLLGPAGLLIGLDVDPNNLEFASKRLADVPCTVRLFHANFTELDEVMSQVGAPPIHGILADLGISTNQLFEDRYGLSFSRPMALDMRIDPRLDVSAADLVNKLPEDDLADVLYELAQERYSRRIARKIGEARRISPINTTERLAELVRSAVPFSGKSRGDRNRRDGSSEIHPATRTFLALRMKVNRELENTRDLLERAPKYLSKGGRLGVISFQSMEDRVVKHSFRSAEQTGLLKLVTKKPLPPSEAELLENPRSRSAKLRVAEKT